MIFTRDKLISILSHQLKAVDVHNRHRVTVETLSPAQALEYAQTGCFEGVGNKSRIRFLRPKDSAEVGVLLWHTTRRIRNEEGKLLPDPHGEHRWTSASGAVTDAHPYGPALRNVH